MEQNCSHPSFVELHVDDFDPIKHFYSLFGFSIVREDPPSGKDGYLVMEMEGNCICFWPGTSDVNTHSYFSRFDPHTPRGIGVEIVFQVSDIDALFERVNDKVDILEDLQLRPWGQRDFRVADPNGIYLRFSQNHDVRVPLR